MAAALLLCLPASSFAQRRVALVLPGGPAAGATVEVWPPNVLDGYCSGGGGLRRCACPGRVDALVAALEVPPARAPLASAIAGADGVATLPAEPPKDSWLLVRSASGDRGALLGASDPTERVKLTALLPVRFTLGEEEGLDLSRARAVSVDGVTGAVEWLSRQPDGSWVGRTLSAARRHVLVLVPGAHAYVDVSHPDGMGMGLYRAQERREGKVGQVRLSAYRPAEGVVLERGKPAPGAEVVLDPEGCAETTRGDPGGAFHFDHGPSGIWELPVSASRRGRLAAGHAREGARLRLELQAPSTLELTVLGPDKKPVPGVEVGASWSPPSWQPGVSASATTDRAGRARWTFPGSGSAGVRISGKGWVLKGEPRMLVRAGEVARLSAEVEQAATLELVVREADGRPVSGASVQADWGAEPAQGGARVWPSGHGLTDAWGEVRITWLAPGQHVVQVFDRERGRLWGRVTVPGRLELEFGAAPTLELAVVDERGAPVPGLRVALQQGMQTQGGNTDERGGLRRPLAEGDWDLAIYLPRTGGELARQVIAMPAQGRVARTLKVKVPPPSRVMVVDPNQKPIAGAMVFFRTQPPLDPDRAAREPELARLDRGFNQGSYAPGEAPPTTAADGTMTLQVLGPHWVWATAEGFRESSPVEVVRGKARVVLQRCPVAVGRVVDEAGAPVRGATVGGAHLTDAQGRYRVSLRNPGRTVLPIWGRGLLPGRVEVVAPADPKEVQVPDVQLRRAAELMVNVVQAGRPVEHAVVRLAPAPPPDGGAAQPKSGTTDALGRTGFQDLEPGPWFVTLEQSGKPRGKPTRVELVPGEVTALELPAK